MSGEFDCYTAQLSLANPIGSASYTPLANVTSISFDRTVETAEVTNLSDISKRSIPVKIVNGPVSFELNLEAVEYLRLESLTSSLSAANWRLTYPTDVSKTKSFSGILTKLSESIAVGDALKATAEIEISGLIS